MCPDSPALRSALTAVEQRIVAEQGLLRVDGRYANTLDAERQRRVAAVCIWCGRSIRQQDSFTVIGGEPMHDAPCRGEFDTLCYGTEGRD